MRCSIDHNSTLIGQYLYPHRARTRSHCGTLFPLNTQVHNYRARVRVRVSGIAYELQLRSTWYSLWTENNCSQLDRKYYSLPRGFLVGSGAGGIWVSSAKWEQAGSVKVSTSEII